VRALFLYNPEVVAFDYGTSHPFRLERMWLTEHICRSMDLFDAHTDPIRSFGQAEHEDLLSAHEAVYLDALQAASDGIQVQGFAACGLGSGDNPVFPGLWDYVLYTAGGSLRAAQALLDGETDRVFHPGGGLHHAMPRRASGFCYVNDVVLAIQRLVSAGRRVLYLDIDAHHGDGVQHAFYDTDRVLTLSVHQDGRTLFPGSGFVAEIGEGSGSGYSVNVPLLPFASDAEYLRVWDEIVEPLRQAFGPDVVVTELGADALLGDPLTMLELKLHCWWELLTKISAWGLPWLAVGGGGYYVANAMRAWALAWMAIRGDAAPTNLPPAPEKLPGSIADLVWPADFWGAPIGHVGPRPDEMALREVIAEVQLRVFPHHGL
jgi:acetoin utilization protein AcuC